MAGQGGEGMSWADLRGIRAYVADSRFFKMQKQLYLQMMMDTYTRWKKVIVLMAVTFKQLLLHRICQSMIQEYVKHFIKMFLYTDPQGSVSFDVSLKLDFDQKNSVQPTKIDFNNATGTVAFMGQLHLDQLQCIAPN